MKRRVRQAILILLGICLIAACGKEKEVPEPSKEETVTESKQEEEVTQLAEKETENVTVTDAKEEAQEKVEEPSQQAQVKENSKTMIEVGNMSKVEFLEQCPEEIYRSREGIKYPEAEHITYHSKTTGLDRGMNVLLPADYSEENRYPVLYFLHGIFGDEYTMLGDENLHIPQITTNLAYEGIAKEMIIVFPNMYAKTEESQAPGFSAEAVAPYDNFINDLVNDIMPYMEEHYSILTGRENTAIVGFSMGGRETLYIGLNRPDLFGYIGAISPAPGLTPAKDWAMEHKGQMQEDEVYFKDTEHLPYTLMVCCGTQDKTVGQFPKGYHELLTKNKVDHIWYEIGGADHDFNAIRSGVNNFVSAIFHQD